MSLVKEAVNWWRGQTERQNSDVMIGYRVHDGGMMPIKVGDPIEGLYKEYQILGKAKISFTEKRLAPVGPWQKDINSATAVEIPLEAE